MELMNMELFLITCFLSDNSTIALSIEKDFIPEMLDSPVYRQVYQEMIKRIDSGKTVDLNWYYLYTQEITGKPTLDYQEYWDWVVLIPSQVFSIIEGLKIEYLKKKVRRLSDNLDKNNEGFNAKVDGVIGELQGLYYLESVPDSSSIKDQIINDVDNGIQCSTGYLKLDSYVWGIEPGAYWTIGGHTHNCKTMFALNLAFNLINQDIPVTYFSTEMSIKDLYERLNIMVSGINPNLCDFRGEKKERYKASLDKTLSLPIQFYQTFSLSPIINEIRKAKSQLYVVDHIQQIDTGQKRDNDVQRLGEITRLLEKQTKESRICTIAISQFGREKVGEEPGLASFRGSGEIEENADIGILMYYPHQQQRNFKKKKAIEKKGTQDNININIAKNRVHGLSGHITYRLDRCSLHMHEVE